MTTVYDIINDLRKAKNMSIRKMAEAAGMSPSTLDAILKNRTQGITVLRLKQMASAFGLEWTDLFETGREHSVGKGEKAKVNSYIKEEEQPYILEHAFRKANLAMPFQPDNEFEPEPEPERELDLGKHYLKVLNATIKELNTDGLKEAMYSVMSIARRPEYNIANKENKGKTGV